MTSSVRIAWSLAAAVWLAATAAAAALACLVHHAWRRPGYHPSRH